MKNTKIKKKIKPKMWTLPVHYETKFDDTWRQIVGTGFASTIRLRTSLGMIKKMKNLLRAGLHGKTLEEVAERLLCEALRGTDFWRMGLTPKP